MKRFVVTIALLFALASSTYAGKVVLTADEVTSAVEIEDALADATQSGSEPGVVILDGRKGPFKLGAPDTSINLFYSNVLLLGLHGAKITNCNDGLAFDPSVDLISDVSIQGITFECTGNGITDLTLPLAKDNIFIYGNKFKVHNNGILINNVDNLKVIGNDIQAGTGPVPGSTVISIFLGDSTRSKVIANKLSGYDGIHLHSGSNKNSVIGNEVCVYNSPGVFLDDTTFDNNVIGNRIASATADEVVAVEDLGENNKIIENRVVKRQCR